MSRRRRSADSAGSSDFQTGIGAPQKRLRPMFQSRALASQLPKMPSRMCAGTQVIPWFSWTMRVVELR